MKWRLVGNAGDAASIAMWYGLSVWLCVDLVYDVCWGLGVSWGNRDGSAGRRDAWSTKPREMIVSCDIT